MSKKHTSENTRKGDTPYDPSDEQAVREFWGDATAHKGIAELRAKRGRPRKGEHEKKQKIAIRLDADVLAWYREQGPGWQTRMNAVLKAFRDASNS